jgi:GNAT superfamily N-acetyltransferase
MSAVSVCRATLDDLAYIDHLRRQNGEALGFLSLAKYEAIVTGQGPEARPSNRLWVAAVDGEQVGFLYLTPGRPGGAAKIIQACVQEDARRHRYATALVAEAESYARLLQRGGVSLAVAVELEAAAFWQSLGYVLRGHALGGERRGRTLERRTKVLPSDLLVALEAAQHPRRRGAPTPETSRDPAGLHAPGRRGGS